MLFKSSTETKTVRYPRMLLSGTQRLQASEQRHWIPAYAGMTKIEFMKRHTNQTIQPTKTQGDTP